MDNNKNKNVNYCNMKYKSRNYALIDLNAARKNVLEAKKRIPPQTLFCAVLKTDAYGHGAKRMARAIDDLVDYYAMATVEEGMELRGIGITKPILILGPVPESEIQTLISGEMIPSVFTLAQAEAVSKAAVLMGKTVTAHLAVDTGMCRIGIRPSDPQAIDTAIKISQFPNIKLQGAFTHFATADCKEKSFAKEQLEAFLSFMDELEKAGLSIPFRHVSNSAGIIEGLGTELSMVRDGISLYGIYPSREVSMEALPLSPVLSWRARISHIKKVPKNTPVSYGSTYFTKDESIIATIPVGYGDGLPRALSGKASFLLHGTLCPVLGRICMDQCMIDITNIATLSGEGEVKVGDEVTIIGRDGNKEISLYDWEDMGLFSYEVLCGINKRVPRIYISEFKELENAGNSIINGKNAGMEIREFLSRLSSKEPVPGGGGASALSGAYGVALALMVCNLTSGKKKFADFEPRLQWIMGGLQHLKEEFLALSDEDEVVFLPLSRAYSLPEGNDEEKKSKRDIMESCLLNAALTPLKIMEKACEGLKYMEELYKSCSRLAISDVGVGAKFLETALQGAAMNVYINTKYMKNREKAEELNEFARRYIEDGTHLSYEIYNAVEEIIK